MLLLWEEALRRRGLLILSIGQLWKNKSWWKANEQLSNKKFWRFEDCVIYTMYDWKHDAFTVGVHPIPWPPVSKPKYLPLSIKPHLLLKSLPNISSMFLFPLTQRKRGSGRQPSLINMLGFICDNSSWHNINGQLCPSEVSLMQMRRGKQLTFERRADDSKWQGYVNYRSQ